MELIRDHPRYESLRLRELIATGYEHGLVDRTGLIAHGRGEAFDYLLGERTHAEASDATLAAAAHLLLAENPVISVNGNTAVLVPDELVALSNLIPARLEVNIFHRTEERVDKLLRFLESHGAKNVLGRNPDAVIPGLNQVRARCTKTGIFSADVVFVPLEDGDRAKALVDMKKAVIVVDLNPLSRSAGTATITIVDNICRAVNVLMKHIAGLKIDLNKDALKKIVKEFNNEQNLKLMLKHLELKNIDID